MLRFDSGTRKIVNAVLGAAVGCALSMTAANAMAQTVLKLAHVGSNEDSAFAAGANAFAAKFAELTKGRYKVEIFGNSTLGNETQIIDGLKAGTVDVVVTGLAGPAPAMVPELGVIVLPGLFTGPDHVRAVLDGPIGQKILDAMPARGVIGLGLGSNGFRHVLVNSKPVKTLEDMKGMKFRIPNSATLEAVFKAWGAEPVKMNVNDVYNALKTGRVDGMENAIPNANSYNFFDHIKYVVMNNYSYSSLVFMASPDTFDELSDDDKTALKDAGKAGAQATRDFVDAEEKKLIDELKGKGVTFITDFDQKAFADAIKPVQSELGKKFGDLYTDILATK